MLNRTLISIDDRQITPDNAFRHRSGPDSESHLSTLRKTLRNTGKLDPVTVWQEVDANNEPTGRLVLLDGHYRMAAHKAEWSAGRIEKRHIPAMLVKCSRIDAHLLALSANSKDNLPLTPVERLNAAWTLVMKFRQQLSKQRLSRACGVSERTIARMRQQLRKFVEAEETPNGNWMVDRQFPEENAYKPPSDDACRKMIDDLSVALKTALQQVRTQDVQIVGEALHAALGQRQFSLIVDYLGAADADDDGGTGWMVPDDYDALPDEHSHYEDY